jgi:hypothetical protein
MNRLIRIKFFSTTSIYVDDQQVTDLIVPIRRELYFSVNCGHFKQHSRWHGDDRY